MDLYEILGVPRGAGGAEIRRAYRRLARKYHPDINPGDREAQVRFAQIARAFETLIDPNRRRAYDAGVLAEPADSEPAPGFEGFDFSIQVSTDQSVSTFGELFADVFTRAGRAAEAGPQPGADLHVQLSLTMDEAMRGVERHLAVTRYVACQTCRGAGTLPMEPVLCRSCRGEGRIRSARGHMVFTRPCGACGGTGQLTLAACRTCGGRGMEVRVDAIPVQVMGGVEDGAELRLAGCGHGGRMGGAPGHLFVHVNVMPHPVFRREGDDLHLVLPVAVHEAALGARIDVPTFDGSVRLTVPPGTQSGQSLRVRERGAPATRSGGRGDLIAEVRLVLPPQLDERSRELLREFGRLNAGDVRRDWWSGRMASNDNE